MIKLKLSEGGSWEDIKEPFGVPIEGTYCSECGRQVRNGYPVKLYHVPDLDDTFCEDCVVKKILDDSIMGKYSDEKTLHYLENITKKLIDPNFKIIQLDDNLYTSAFDSQYKFDIKEGIDYLYELLSDEGGQFTKGDLEKAFPDYDFETVRNTEYDTLYQ